jgi:membrane protease YdiL (CAAX protease family)
MSTSASSPTFATALPRWQVLLVLVGLPALYLANSFTPWSMGLFVRQEHAFFLPFWSSVAVLHWLSVALVLVLLARAGGRLKDIGLDLSLGNALVMIGPTIAAGAALVLLREHWSPSEGPPPERNAMFPATRGERVFWVFMSVTAGLCEELIYRGFAIRLLQGRGLRTWLAVGLATLSFVFVHGLAGLFLFPIYFVAGLLFAALFLWRRSLVPGVCLHALYDVALIGYT